MPKGYWIASVDVHDEEAYKPYAAALACYRSPEYQANIKVRQPHSMIDIIIIEGYDGPQP